jgi:hypothetical protein
MWFMTVVLMFPAAPDPIAATIDMNYTVVVMGGVLSLAFGYYYFPGYGGRHWFKGPISNVRGDLEENDFAVEEKAESQ